MERAPEPKWLRLARNVEIYGVRAVFGRDVLHEYEMDAMRIMHYIVDTYHVRSRSSDWAKWNKDNPSDAKALDWAAAEFEKRKDQWEQ